MPLTIINLRNPYCPADDRLQVIAASNIADFKEDPRAAAKHCIGNFALHRNIDCGQGDCVDEIRLD
jgi:hypothetical protein